MFPPIYGLLGPEVRRREHTVSELFEGFLVTSRQYEYGHCLAKLAKPYTLLSSGPTPAFLTC